MEAFVQNNFLSNQKHERGCAQDAYHFNIYSIGKRNFHPKGSD
jgi:hypothetical protein